MKKYSLIVACCRSNGIGKGNDLPWRLKKEMEYFTRITSTVRHQYDLKGDVDVKKNAVVMGMRTYLSIPPRYRPLKDRVNVVLSRRVTELPAGCSYLFSNFNEAISVLSTLPEIDQIFIIGGEEVYKEAMLQPMNIDYIFLTRLNVDIDCDRFFPEFDSSTFEEVTGEHFDPKEKKRILSEMNIPEEEQLENDIPYRYHLYRPALPNSN